MSTHQFQTEVSQLLQLIIHSLYSHKEIFLRELVSNSSDALDKFKYLTLTDDRFKTQPWSPRIDVEFAAAKDGNGTLTIRDNGIGMSEAELIENLGTIAKSGTKAFLSQLSGDARKDSNLIGQFGVGFYSAFMVADRIEVTSHKAGEEGAYKWASDGKGSFATEKATRPEGQGTTLQLFLNDEGKEYANQYSLRDLIKKYSNHIAFPIFLHFDKDEYDDKGKQKGTTRIEEQVNSASALWKRSKSELKDDDYKEFYKSIGHDADDPLLWLHTQAEGGIEYATLFFIPKKAPFDLYYADYKPGVKLYVRRVFITDDDKELLPTWMRFVRGVIDSEDLPLNVSREILQQNKILEKIRDASIKKILGELARAAKDDPETYKTFVGEYNRCLKEGVYADYANREQILELLRFKSTKVEGWTSFAEYKERMQPDQKAIYFLSGGDEARLRASPVLEAYKAKNIEVLILDDDIDEIVMSQVNKFKETDVKDVKRADTVDDIKQEKDEAKEKESAPILEKIKKALGDRVKDVRVSSRLSDSPSCIVADSSDPSFQIQEMMRSLGRLGEVPEVKPILEINPDHAIVASLKGTDNEERIADVSVMLFDQAILLEGGKIADTPDFVKRLNRILSMAV